MFNTIGSFSAVYFTLAAILFILVLFEKYFIRLEDKIKADRAAAKKPAKTASIKKTANKNKQSSCRNTATERTAAIRKIPNNAA